MSRRLFVTGIILLPASPALAGSARSPKVRITTNLGNIDIKLDLARAPITGGNFLRVIKAGSLAAGGGFYRSVAPDRDSNFVPIRVIQGGLGQLPKPFDPIAHESTKITGLRHADGTISMARAAPGTATTEFFICIGDNPALDYGGERAADGEGFAAFGQVTRGMDVVREIHGLPTSDEGAGTAVAQQMLSSPLAISSTSLR